MGRVRQSIETYTIFVPICLIIAWLLQKKCKDHSGLSRFGVSKGRNRHDGCRKVIIHFLARVKEEFGVN
jgi:hypothetical protein